MVQSYKAGHSGFRVLGLADNKYLQALNTNQGKILTMSRGSSGLKPKKKIAYNMRKRFKEQHKLRK